MSETVQGVWLPVYYEGNAPFLDSDGDPSGAAGAEATVTIDVNNRPQKWTSLRVVMAYDLPPFEDFGAANAILSDFLDRIKDIEDQCTLSVDLSESNIVVGDAHLRGVQGGVKGSGGVIYHPFPTPMLWRGGNNVTLTFKRILSFPSIPLDDTPDDFQITPTVYVVTEGCQLFNDLVPPRGAPSTGWPNS